METQHDEKNEVYTVKGFCSQVTDDQGEDRTVVMLEDLESLIEQFKAEFPDIPLDEVPVFVQGKTLASAVSYNTEGKAKEVTVHFSPLLTQQD